MQAYGLEDSVDQKTHFQGQLSRWDFPWEDHKNVEQSSMPNPCIS